MNWSEVSETVTTVLTFPLFEVSGTPVSVTTLATVVLIVAFTFWGSRAGQTGVERAFRLRGLEHHAAGIAIGGLLRYALLVGGLAVAAQTLGIRLGALFTAGAIFAVGLGFAMKEVAENFVSGVILLSEGSIRPGDIIQVQQGVARVKSIGIRTTLVITRDGEELIMPNSLLCQSTRLNYTLSDKVYRVRVTVGVVYSADMALVRKTLVAVGEAMRWRDRTLPVSVLMSDFGSSSVDFEVQVWSRDPWEERTFRSELREAIWWAFKEHDITIAFPQLDVHFDAPVTGGLQSLHAVADRSA